MFAFVMISPAMQLGPSGRQAAIQNSSARQETNQNGLHAKQAHVIKWGTKQLQGMISGCIHVPLGSLP